MKRFSAITLLGAMILNFVLGVAPAFAGIVSQFSDTVSVHTTSAPSNHTLTFVTPTGVESSSDTILITFQSGFDLTSLVSPGDFDLAVGSTGTCSSAVFADETLAASAAAGVWGVAVSGQQVTFTAPTDAGAGEIPAGRCVQIEIGEQATFGVAGVNQITNPGTTGSKTVWLSGTFADSGEVGVAITTPGQVSVGATVTGGSNPGGGGGGGGGGGPPPADTRTPIISNVLVPVIGPTNAEIYWETDELANSAVDYGLTTSYELGTVTNPDYVFSRRVPVGGLMQGTTYHFRVRSADAAGNGAQAGDFTFTTITGPDTFAPIISGVNVTNITETSATIGWSTNEPSDSLVRYGLTPSYGSQESDPTQVTSHFLQLTGLTPVTQYHFRVFSADAAGNIGESGDLTFSTVDLTAPIINNLQVTGITETSAIVSWTTNEETFGYLQYGTSTAYGSFRETNLSTEHAVVLTGLNGSTQYFFEVRATDVSRNTVTAASTFTTAPDQTSPTAVSDLVVVPGDRSNTLMWQNPADPDFDEVFIYRRTTDFPSGPGNGVLVYRGSGESFTDTGLANDTRYFYGVFTQDETGNYGAGALADGTPTGEEVPPVCGNGICDGGESNSMCPADCPFVPVCGNGICEAGENQTMCPADCSAGQVEPRDLNSFFATDIQVTIRNRGVMIQPTAQGVFDVLAGSDILVAVPDRVIAGSVRLGTLTIGNEQYRMFRGGSYDAFVQLPNSITQLQGVVRLDYEDGNWDQATFTLNLLGEGNVYELIDEVRTPVSGATVTLYDYFGGKHAVATGTTDVNGNFVFVVQPGTYSVTASKTGYGAQESAATYVNAIVHPSIPLVKVTPIDEILNSDQPVIDKALDLIQELGARLRIIRDNPNVQEQADVLAPTAAAIAIVNAVALLTIATIANAGAWFQYLFLQPLLWFSRRKRKGWGTVYDSLTKLPIDLAVVRLMDAATGRLLQSRVTDKEGRYFFILDPGRYRIQVVKPGFVFPSVYLKDAKEDTKYTELYHAEELVVTESGSTLAANIPLDPVGKAMVPAHDVIVKNLWRKLQVALSWLSIVAGVVAAYLAPSILTLGLLVLQIVMFFLFHRLAKGKKPKGWGIVYDDKTRQPLPNAVVRIFEPKYNKLLDTYVTDSQGRYAFIVGPSVYYTTYERAGYSPHRMDNLDYTKSGDSAVVSTNVSLMKATPGAIQAPQF